MAGAVAADFEVDQWTFFKPTPRRPVRALRHRPARGAALPRLPDADRDPARGGSDGDARGRLVLPARRRGHGLPHRPREVDDRRRVDRRGRQGAALLPQHRLPRAVRRGLRQAVRDVLRRRPPADLRRAAPLRRRPGAVRRRRCAASPASCSRAYLARRPADNPFTRFSAAARGRPAARCSRGRRRTTTPTRSTTRGWSAPRWSCSPATCAGCSARTARRPRPARRRGRRLEDAAVPAGPAARLRRGRRGRRRWPRRTPPRSPSSTLWLSRRRAHRPRVRAGDAGAGPGRRRGHPRVRRALHGRRAQGVLEVGGIATVWDLLVDGDGRRARAGRCSSGTSVDVGRRRPRGASRRAPAHRAARRPCPTKPRQRWRTMLVEEPGCAGCAPSSSAARPASRPGRRWSAPTGRWCL